MTQTTPPKRSFFRTHARRLQNLSLAAMLILPLALYWAAEAGSDLLTIFLLGLMALLMLLVVKLT